jgi:hypothetical protein
MWREPSPERMAMFASPNNAKVGYGVRIITVIFSLAVLYLKLNQSHSDVSLVIYMFSLAVLMILSQTATTYSVSRGVVGSSGAEKFVSPLDAFIIHLISLIVIFAHSILNLSVPTSIIVFASATALSSGLYGILLTYRSATSRR